MMRRTQRSDARIAANKPDVALLRAVEAGRVVRGSGADTSIFAPHFLDGEPVRLQLRWLAGEQLMEMPISGPPTIAPRGERVLSLAAEGIPSLVEGISPHYLRAHF
jgi:hypothetical protein